MFTVLLGQYMVLQNTLKVDDKTDKVAKVCNFLVSS